MRAAVYEKFEERPEIRLVADPVASANGVVISVKACGVCRSDWHGWMGNDPDIVLPHVPGHELAGVVAETGKNVGKWQPGDRVTVPFVCGCGECGQCRSGNQQVCDRQFQPGFTAWGAFAEYVAVEYADENLVRLPDDLEFVTAASLGCRFITSYRALVDQAKIKEGEWIAVFGCGGVGLSAIMISKAFGCRVVAVDLKESKFALAKSIGADLTVNAALEPAVEAIREATGGGAHVSIDAIGSPHAAHDSLSSLRKRGKHIQIGIMEKDEHDVAVPMNLVIANELAILGSHGMQAHRYPEMLGMIESGRLKPELLIGGRVSLDESLDLLINMGAFPGTGVTVIDSFGD